jgi:DNA-binding transcriptional LysR family regulator
MRVNYLGLEAFLAVAELGSFSKAAARLNLSQTALSHRLRKIEEELGVRLLARTTREVSLTGQGQAILPRVKAQLTALNGLLAELQDEGRKARQRTVFACVPSVALYTLPAVLGEFTARHPDVDLILRDLPAAEIVDQVRAGAVEFGLAIMGAGHWDLDSEPQMVEPYHLLVARTHRLAGRASVTLDDLPGETMVRIRTQSTNRELVEAALEPVRAQIRFRYDVLNAVAALSMVATGQAITVLPRQMGLLGWGQVVGLPFADVEISRQLGLVWRRGVPLSDAAQQLADLLRGHMTGAATGVAGMPLPPGMPEVPQTAAVEVSPGHPG